MDTPGTSARSQASTNSLAADKSAKVDLLISLHLQSWPALTLALQNCWGGPLSDDKRAWLAGAISELLATGQVADADDLEEVLLQVMLDEFEVVVDDGSPAEVAAGIIRGKGRILKGDYAEVEDMLVRWEAKQKQGLDKVQFREVEAAEADEQDTDWDSGEDESEDVEMDEAPNSGPSQKLEKPKPEVDEEGFTKVTGKAKR